ncbi:hypothetical protein EDD86DRAFT_207041 [Gorgonomyces haynaldii]|nr:hypothetical protein EDD86DRAFT_207041 [Gorgonomyces haynaldii]
MQDEFRKLSHLQRDQRIRHVQELERMYGHIPRPQQYYERLIEFVKYPFKCLDTPSSKIYFRIMDQLETLNIDPSPKMFHYGLVYYKNKKKQSASMMMTLFLRMRDRKVPVLDESYETLLHSLFKHRQVANIDFVVECIKSDLNGKPMDSRILRKLLKGFVDIYAPEKALDVYQTFAKTIEDQDIILLTRIYFYLGRKDDALSAWNRIATKDCWNAFLVLIEGYQRLSRNDPELLKEAHQLLNRGFQTLEKPSVPEWNQILKFLVDIQDKSGFEKAYAEMIASGSKPDFFTSRLRTRIQIMNRETDKLQESLTAFLQNPVERQSFEWQTYVDALQKKGYADFLDSLKSKVKELHEKCPDPAMYHTEPDLLGLIQRMYQLAFQTQKRQYRWVTCIHLFRNMKNNRIPITPDAASIYMYSLMRIGKKEELFQFVDSPECRSLPKLSYLYDTQLQTLAHFRNVDLVRRVLTEASAHGYKPNQRTWKTLLLMEAKLKQ